MLLYLSALGSRCLPQGGQRKVRTRNDGDRISIIRTVAGNARRGNPRDANRDADAERLGTRKGELHGNMEVQRQKSYLRARPCLSTPRVVTREPLEVSGDTHPRYMVAPDRIRLTDETKRSPCGLLFVSGRALSFFNSQQKSCGQERGWCSLREHRAANVQARETYSSGDVLRKN